MNRPGGRGWRSHWDAATNYATNARNAVRELWRHRRRSDPRERRGIGSFLADTWFLLFAAALAVVAVVVVTTSRKPDPAPPSMNRPVSVSRSEVPKLPDEPGAVPAQGCSSRPMKFERTIGRAGTVMNVEIGTACHMAKLQGEVVPPTDLSCAAYVEVAPWTREQVSPMATLNGEELTLVRNERTGHWSGWARTTPAGRYTIDVAIDGVAHPVSLVPSSFRPMNSNTFEIGRAVCRTPQSS